MGNSLNLSISKPANHCHRKHAHTLCAVHPLLTSTMLLVAMGRVAIAGADTADPGEADTGVGANPVSRLLLRLMCTYVPPSAGGSSNGGLPRWCGLPPWEDTLLLMLDRIVLLLLLLLWRALLCLAIRSSDSSLQAMAGGTSCIISTARPTTAYTTNSMLHQSLQRLRDGLRASSYMHTHSCYVAAGPA